LVAQGLLVVLLGSLGTLGRTQYAIALPILQTPNTSQTNAVAQQLLGQWQAKDPKSKEVLTFIFAPEGKLFVVLPPRDGSAVALKVDYKINPTTQPMQLDIQLSPQETALTIFEFTSDGKLRLALEGLTPGLPRPTEFPSNATLLSKISQATTVAENIQVIELQTIINSHNQRAETEAKKYMYALTKVQQAHYQEQGKFATTIAEVSIGLRTETEFYRYQIVPQGDNTQSVMLTAVAKKPELPSYTGAVFVTQVNGKATTVSQICETEKPATSPPAMPKSPSGDSLRIQCPLGSRSLL